MARVGFSTLGCKVNQYDTDALKKAFTKAGWKIEAQGDSPDVFVVNSCTVTNEAARQSRQRLRKKGFGKKSPLLVLWGCYPEAYPQETREISGVDLVLGRIDPEEVVREVEEKMGNVFGKKEKTEIQTSERTRAYLKIEDGCEAFCSYCIVPRARGKVRSKPWEEIKKELEELIAFGYKEIVLTGIHLGAYGKDLDPGNSLDRVVKNILKADVPRLRLSSLEINEVSPLMLDLIAENNSLCPHLHLPLQSGSDKILRRMNRHYSGDEFLEKVSVIRERIPEIAISTDIMVGFPSETDEDFQRTIEIAKKAEFSRMHVFPYSPKKGTRAAEMKEQIPGSVKKERGRKLREIGEEMQRKYNQRFLHKNIEVLVENTAMPAQGLTPNYIRVYLPETVKRGKLVQVRTQKIYRDGLWGKEIDNE